MERGYWVIRTWQAGQVGEKVKFWVPGEKPSRSERRIRAEARKRLDNAVSAERRVARLLNGNFRPGDCLMGLDYSDKGLFKLRGRIGDLSGMDEGEVMNAVRLSAEQELRNFLRRAKRAAAKDGVEVRYLAITSDMDGETGEAVRIHHHLVVNREAVEYLRRKWTAGGVFTRWLENQKDYTPVAVYLMDQVRRIGREKKYIPARNLRQPRVKDRTGMSGAELRAPKGAELLYRSAYIPGRPQYIRFYQEPNEKQLA